MPAWHRLYGLVYPRRVDPAVPIGAVAETVDDLVKQGKVRFLGL